jgi:hypothetical protein
MTEHINGHGGTALPLPASRIRVTSDAPASLETLADQINGLLASADTHRQCAKNARIAAGKRLLEAKRRVEAGEAGEITWTDWVQRHVRRSERDIQKLLRIAGSGDPEKAHEAEKARARAGMRKTRAKARAANVSRPKPKPMPAPPEPPKPEAPEPKPAPSEPAAAPVGPRPSLAPSARERWLDACGRAMAALEELLSLQLVCLTRYGDTPESLRGSVTAAKLHAVACIDIDSAIQAIEKARAADLPNLEDDPVTGGLVQ